MSGVHGIGIESQVIFWRLGSRKSKNFAIKMPGSLEMSHFYVKNIRSAKF